MGTAYSESCDCSAVVIDVGTKTCIASEMGTAYSEIWACSASVIGGGPTAEATLVRCLRAAAQNILRCSDSSCSMALRWVSRVRVRWWKACEAEEILSLPCVSMCRTWRRACA